MLSKPVLILIFFLEQDELFEDSYDINGETPNEQNHTDVSDYQQNSIEN